MYVTFFNFDFLWRKENFQDALALTNYLKVDSVVTVR